MHLLATVPQTTVELAWEQDIVGAAEMRARQLRGALAQTFDHDLFHQHDPQGRVLYRYPPIQYRWRRGRGVITGWNEGADMVRALPWLDLELVLNVDPARVRDALIGCRQARFGVGGQLQRYALVSPVLLFNQNNYPGYRDMDRRRQRDERDRLLVAAILTALRGLNVYFDAHLYASFVTVYTRVSPFKGQELLGFTGQFVSNAVLPDGFAVGHAISHGYGWIESVDEGGESAE